MDRPGELAWDHPEIVRLAKTEIRRRYAGSADPEHLLGRRFTLRELQRVHEAVGREDVDRDRFRRAMEPVVATGDQENTGSRGARGTVRPEAVRPFPLDTQTRIAAVARDGFGTTNTCARLAATTAEHRAPQGEGRSRCRYEAGTRVIDPRPCRPKRVRACPGPAPRVGTRPLPRRAEPRPDRRSPAPSDPPIQGDQRSVQGFGEGDRPRRSSSDFPELPHPLRENLIRKQIHRQVRQVGVRLGCLVRADQPGQFMTSNDVRALEGQQRGAHTSAAASRRASQSPPSPESSRTVTIAEASQTSRATLTGDRHPWPSP